MSYKATTDEIRALRAQTDAPVGDCKNAIEAANGDMAEAERIVLTSGKGSKRATVPDEGAIAIAESRHGKVMAQFRCETDFTARSPKFLEAAQKAANVLATLGHFDTDGYQEISFEANQLFQHGTAAFGEKCELGEFVYANRMGPDEYLAAYLHHDRRRAAVVNFGSRVEGGFEAAAKVAAHVVAMSPKAIDRASLPPEDVAALEADLRHKAIADGKPEKAIDKIVAGQLSKRLAESVLMDQPYYADPSITVGQFCENSGITINAFRSLVV